MNIILDFVMNPIFYFCGLVIKYVELAEFHTAVFLVIIAIVEVTQLKRDPIIVHKLFCVNCKLDFSITCMLEKAKSRNVSLQRLTIDNVMTIMHRYVLKC